MISEGYLELLSIEEACEILMVGKSTLYKMLSAGEIPGAFRIGKVWKIPKMVVVEFVTKKVQEGKR